jgi:hypothetical protein
MKTLIVSAFLLSSSFALAQDCQRIQLHIEQLQEQLYQCQAGGGGRPGTGTSSTICSVAKSGSYWDLQVSGSTIQSSYDFESVASEAMNKDSNGLCRFDRPACSVQKSGSYWDLTVAGSTVQSSYDFESVARKATELDSKGYCRAQVASCSVEKSGSYWDLKINGSTIQSAYDFDSMAKKKNDLVSEGLCR